jgi:hypothetical protein
MLTVSAVRVVNMRDGQKNSWLLVAGGVGAAVGGVVLDGIISG